ncbi:MAG TPA: TIGR03089 family protein [Micromonosporaceae bacterium]
MDQGTHVKDLHTVGRLFQTLVAPDPTRPLLTFYDDATGERTELSGATLGNWVAKTANTLVDDLDLEPGQWAAVGLPPHWQTAAVLLGCWTVGLAVTTAPDPAEVAFLTLAAACAEWPAVERYVLGLHPFGLPLPSVPTGCLDFTSEIRTHGDHFSARTPVTAATPALRWTDADAVTHEHTQSDLCTRAAERAAALGVPTGGRVLINTDAHPDPVDWLVAPLAAGATMVLSRNTDTTKFDARAAAELVTRTIR